MSYASSSNFEMPRDAHRNRKFRALLRELGLLGRMVAAVARGDYELAVPKTLLALAGIGYVANPFDVVPEAVVGPLGLGDDAAVLAATLSALAVELAAFRTWEIRQSAATA